MICAGELARCQESEHLVAEVRGLQAEPEKQKAAWAAYQQHMQSCPICRQSVALLMDWAINGPVSAETAPPIVAEVIS